MKAGSLTALDRTAMRAGTIRSGKTTSKRTQTQQAAFVFTLFAGPLNSVASWNSHKGFCCRRRVFSISSSLGRQWRAARERSSNRNDKNASETAEKLRKDLASFKMSKSARDQKGNVPGLSFRGVKAIVPNAFPSVLTEGPRFLF